MAEEGRQLEVRQLNDSDRDAMAFTRIMALAYTGYRMYVDGTFQQVTEEVKEWTALFSVFGLFDTAQVNEDADTIVESGRSFAASLNALPGLVAEWIHRDFQCNLFGSLQPIGGIASVAVGLLDKKQGLAKRVITEFLEECDRRGQALAALQPFRTDFYAKMGFATAVPCYDYVLNPMALPLSLNPDLSCGPLKKCLVELTKDDVPEMIRFYKKFAEQRHGVIVSHPYDLIEVAFKGKNEQTVYGFRDATGELQGYLVVEFLPTALGRFVNDIKVHDMLYLTTAVLSTFLRFLRLQADQIRYIRVTTPEADFYRLLTTDIHNAEMYQRGPTIGPGGNAHQLATESLGLMMRVVNVEKLFRIHFSKRNFNGMSAVVLFQILDTLTPEKNKPLVVEFFEGSVKRVEPVNAQFDRQNVVVIETDVSSFSALVVGATNVPVLLRYGKLKVTPAAQELTVTKLFSVHEAPVSFVYF